MEFSKNSCNFDAICYTVNDKRTFNKGSAVHIGKCPRLKQSQGTRRGGTPKEEPGKSPGRNRKKEVSPPEVNVRE